MKHCCMLSCVRVIDRGPDDDIGEPITIVGTGLLTSLSARLAVLPTWTAEGSPRRNHR
jgi:hypothetical protein